LKTALGLAGILLAMPALAIEPTFDKADKTQCTLVYDKMQTMTLKEYAGDQVTVIFGPNEGINLGSVSNKDMVQDTLDSNKNVNMFTFKALDNSWKVPPFQFTVRTTTNNPDFPFYDYEILLTVLPPVFPKPLEIPPAQPAQLAAAGNPAELIANTTEALQAKPKVKESERISTCLVVRYTHPVEEKATAAAKARVNWQVAQQVRLEQELRTKQTGPQININYDYQGDRDIGPHGNPNGVTITDRADLYDDGSTTFLHYPGNQRMPVFYTIKDDDTDGEVIDAVHEDNGLVKLMGVFPKFRARQDTTKALCLFNRHVTDTTPTSGTSTPDIQRSVRVGK
jgi:type IV secretory pathway VirB9-like protein